ncbi:GAF and ANTAR domain-containing protein [Amycolatopsis azurea]|uniref:GAF and ANTAR domain-containing protein n=1 Tax=Amycolatopsis azurea TaxID=36819 RepID=UPI003820528C
MTISGTRRREEPDWTAVTGELLAARTIPDALRVIAETAERLITAADLITVSLHDHDPVSVPTGQRPVAVALERAQRVDGGPSTAALDPSGPGFTVSDDLCHDTRWPHFAAIAGGHGLRAVVSAECRESAAPDHPAGALTVYSRHSGRLTEHDRRTALVLASQCSLTLARLRLAEESRLRRARLLDELEIRDIIGQAAGILMHRRGYTAAVATGMLRQWAAELDMNLLDLAQTLLELDLS